MSALLRAVLVHSLSLPPFLMSRCHRAIVWVELECVCAKAAIEALLATRRPWSTGSAPPLRMFCRDRAIVSAGARGGGAVASLGYRGGEGGVLRLSYKVSMGLASQPQHSLFILQPA
jgi:hypothetical protein